jgi:hypothetical protein
LSLKSQSLILNNSQNDTNKPISVKEKVRSSVLIFLPEQSEGRGDGVADGVADGVVFPEPVTAVSGMMSWLVFCSMLPLIQIRVVDVVELVVGAVVFILRVYLLLR